MVTRCCEKGRAISVDPQTGQTICSCQYSATPGMMNAYPRVPGMGEVVYPSAAVTAAAVAAAGVYQQGGGVGGYLTAPHGLGGIPGPDGTPMYTSLTLPPFEATKEAVENWRNSLPPSAGMYFPYDTSLAYSYPPGFGPIDLNAARRKNATKEATNTLKAWLYEHRKNPYPTKGEKIMLAIITKMTLTQVSTWFANARRRLKKDNKMTWSPKNRSDDEDGDDFGDDDNDNSKDDDDDDDKFDSISDVSINEKENNLSDLFPEDDKKVDRELEIEVNVDDMNDTGSRSSSPISTSLTPEVSSHSRVPGHAQCSPQQSQVSPATDHRLETSDRPEQYISARLPTLPERPSDLTLSNNCKEQNDSSTPSPVKPKIWSMTDVLRNSCSKTRINSNGSSSNSSSSSLSNSSSSRKDISPISANTDHFRSAIELHSPPSQFTSPSQGQCYAFLSGNGGATHTWFPSNPLGGAPNTFTGQHHYNPYSLLSKPPGMTPLSYPYSFSASSAGPIKTPIPTMRPLPVVPLRPEVPFAPRIQTNVMGH